MRHTKHRFELGVKKEHRESLIANLATQLFTYGRIKTTLVKAKALRPFAEKVITLAKKASKAENVEEKLHFRRLALARVRSRIAIRKLFTEDVQQFLDRSGGYTRIYKLVPRVGDGAPMGLIEYVSHQVGEKHRRKSVSKKLKPAEVSGAESASEDKNPTGK
ncbi:MAG: 50S ribosomal protein L17 [Puniceicoccales bacterium]|jgi:large subunit ribosomal protein L17|nr:50S ribosomal protein L17 [Puniceicoccales bacterium]